MINPRSLLSKMLIRGIFLLTIFFTLPELQSSNPAKNVSHNEKWEWFKDTTSYKLAVLKIQPGMSLAKLAELNFGNQAFWYVYLLDNPELIPVVKNGMMYAHLPIGWLIFQRELITPNEKLAQLEVFTPVFPEASKATPVGEYLAKGIPTVKDSTGSLAGDGEERIRAFPAWAEIKNVFRGENLKGMYPMFIIFFTAGMFLIFTSFFLERAVNWVTNVFKKTKLVAFRFYISNLKKKPKKPLLIHHVFTVAEMKEHPSFFNEGDKYVPSKYHNETAPAPQLEEVSQN